MDDVLADLVRRAHGGEVLGVELFTRLAAREADPGRRRRLLAAQLLEEQTLAAAEALAHDLGVTLDDAHEQRVAGRAGADALAEMDWASRMEAVADNTGGYRALYARLEDHLDDADQHPQVAALRMHERALHAFADAEVRGSTDALDHLLDALDPAHRDRLAVLGT